MKSFSQGVAVLLALTVPATSVAQVIESTNYAGTIAIPDNDPSGIAVTADFHSTEIYEITDLDVWLEISGGYNGDYYAYLTHDSGFSVLVNRVGRDTGSLYGYPDSGFDVLVNDQAGGGDIHTYRQSLNPNGGVLTGAWAPDGRIDDPGSVLTGSARVALLDSFNGLDPNGAWTLFIADLDPGSSGTLQNWGLNVTGVPEPSVGLMLLTVAGLWMRKRL